MVFDVVAKEIVSNSINTAICIDNDFEEPYSHVENPSNSSFKIPKELYESFKKQNCILDFHKYIGLENWTSKKNMILKNKDLLILDWQLTEGEPHFKDALEILLEAVKTDSLPFIYIYTEKTDLDEIAFYIYSYFSGISLGDLEKRYNLFCNEFEDIIDGKDTKRLFDGIKGKFKEIILRSNDDIIKETKKEIFDYIKNYLRLDQKEMGELFNKLFEIGQKNFDCNDENVLKYLGLILNNGFFRDKTISDIEIRAIEGEKYTFSINNTLVKIASKRINAEDTGNLFVSAEQVYSDFSKTICRRPKNFLALLGLEMRNLYRDRCSIIGKDINDIDELAFFYHQKSLDPDENAFHEFLFNIWKDEVSSFLQDQNPLLFSELNDYKMKNEIDKKLITFCKNSDDVIRNLANLNYYYSISRSQHKLSRKIRFGDIFSFKEDYLFSWKEIPGNDSEKLKYFLKSKYDVDWVKTAKIAKTVNNKTIMITAGKNVLSLNLYNENTELKIIIDNDKTYKLIVKNENGKLNVYKEETSLPIDSFVLCITPHCDCLRPKKNGFFFVGGNEISLKNGVDNVKVDSGFISFVMFNKQLICIDWKTSPFTIHIPVNNIIEPIVCDFLGKKIILNHLAYQKENYTQRIANESFSKANRVGIDFAKLEEEGKKHN